MMKRIKVAIGAIGLALTTGACADYYEGGLGLGYGSGYHG